jgi:signal transduction histidine kinase
MIEYIMSFFITVIQIAAFICFFDIFFDAVSKKKKIIYAAVLTVTAYVVIQQFVYLLGEKRVILQVIFAIFMYLIYTLAVYRQDLSTSLFFVILGYSILLFVDFTIAGLLPIEYLSEWKDYYDVLIILSYIPVFIMLRLMRAGLSQLKSHICKVSSLWFRFGWIPLITFIIGVYLFYVSFLEGKLGFAYTVLGVGIMILDIAFLFMLQGVLVREEEISLVKIREHKNQNQLQAFKDMKSLYDRQSKKLHDYRKQLVTLRELVQQEEKNTAIDFIDELTESISVEISEVNVGHPVINAVLNQTYRVAKGKNIAISLTVGDLHGVMMDGEDIVIVLGNLLENAVNECEKLAGSDRPAVIGVKMVEKGSGFMLTVRNPVREKVEITDNKVQSEPSDGHGIGLLNVEKTVRKYGGDFAISCDDKEFIAVVMIDT